MMSVNDLIETFTGPPPRNAAEHRALLLRAVRQRAEARQQRLADQCSPEKEAHERIALWESLHEIQLPLEADHRLVGVVAKQTGLTVAQVLAEQQRRIEQQA
jgi:hypothetical protein